MTDFDGPDCGVDGCQREVGHIGGSVEVRSPFEDLEDENADLRMTLAAASAELTRLRAALAAEADRATPTHCEGCNVHNICNGIAALDLASPETEDVVARAVHAEDESIESDPPDYDECPDRADHRDYAAALIEAIRQEMER